MPDPYRPMVIDNRPVAPVFLEGSPLTDGMANFATALINAGPAADAIRRQRQADELGQVWKQQEFLRQDRNDALSKLWHDEQQALSQAGMGIERQDFPQFQGLWQEAQQTRDLNQAYRQAQTDQLKNQAFWKSPMGQQIGNLFGGGKNRKPTAAELKAVRDMAEGEAADRGVVIYDEFGKRQVKDPKAWKKILFEAYAAHGVTPPEGWMGAQDPQAERQTLIQKISALPPEQRAKAIQEAKAQGVEIQETEVAGKPQASAKPSGGGSILPMGSTAVGTGLTALALANPEKSMTVAKAIGNAFAKAGDAGASGVNAVLNPPAANASLANPTGELAKSFRLAPKGTPSFSLAATAPEMSTSPLARTMGQQAVSKMGMAGRIMGRAALPATIALEGYELAKAANARTMNDLTPTEGNPMEVLQQFASGQKKLEPDWTTKFGKSLRVAGEQTGAALQRLRDTRVTELMNALNNLVPSDAPRRQEFMSKFATMAKRQDPMLQAHLESLIWKLGNGKPMVEQPVDPRQQYRDELNDQNFEHIQALRQWVMQHHPMGPQSDEAFDASQEAVRAFQRLPPEQWAATLAQLKKGG